MEKTMSKKKSYMDKNNLISEGFFSKFLNKLSKKIDKMEKKSKERQASKNPGVKAAWREVEKGLKNNEKELRAWAKELGLDYD